MAESETITAVTPGEVLRKRVLGDLDIKQDKLADALGVSRFTINQVLNGRRGVSPEMALRLAHVLDTSAEMWLRLQALVDLQDARRRIGEEIESLPQLRKSRSREEFPGLEGKSSQGSTNGASQ